MIKKLLAMLTAGILCMSLAACGGDDSSTTSGNNNVSGGDTTTTSGIKVELNVPEASADFDTSVPLMTIDDTDVEFDVFRYYFLNIKYQLDYGDNSVWDTPEYGQEALDYFKDYVSDQVVLHYFIPETFNELGLTLAPEDKQEIDNYIADLIAQYEDAGYTYEEFLGYNYMTEEIFREVLENDKYYAAIQDHLYGEDGIAANDEDEFVKYVRENYVTCQHILVAFDHFKDDEAYADATEEELKAAAKELADELYDRVVTDGDDLYELSQTYGDDPGMMNNEAGYTFTYGKMVQEFEDKSFELEVGQVSEPVATDYGYHIIKKLELDETELYANAFAAYLTKKLDELNVTYSADFENLKPTSIT